MFLSNLATLLRHRADLRSDAADGTAAIAELRRAVDLTPNGLSDLDRATWFGAPERRRSVTP
jgi:hypothetical protein